MKSEFAQLSISQLVLIVVFLSVLWRASSGTVAWLGRRIYAFAMRDRLVRCPTCSGLGMVVEEEATYYRACETCNAWAWRIPTIGACAFHGVGKRHPAVDAEHFRIDGPIPEGTLVHIGSGMVWGNLRTLLRNGRPPVY